MNIKIGRKHSHGFHVFIEDKESFISNVLPELCKKMALHSTLYENDIYKNFIIILNGHGRLVLDIDDIKTAETIIRKFKINKLQNGN